MPELPSLCPSGMKECLNGNYFFIILYPSYLLLSENIFWMPEYQDLRMEDKNDI